MSFHTILQTACPIIFAWSLSSRLLERLRVNSFIVLTLFRDLLGLRHVLFSSSHSPLLFTLDQKLNTSLADGSTSSRLKLVDTLCMIIRWLRVRTRSKWCFCLKLTNPKLQLAASYQLQLAASYQLQLLTAGCKIAAVTKLM